MTSVTVQNGLVVFKNGAVATESPCCCGGCSGPCTVETISEDCNPQCGCVNEQCVNCPCYGCSPQVSLICDGNTTPGDSGCVDETYFAHGDGIEPPPPGCEDCATCTPHNSHGGNYATMTCEYDPESPRGVRYRVSVVNEFLYLAFIDCIKTCTVNLEGFVEVDEECLPVAGPVTLTEVSRSETGGGCAYLQPVSVEVVRL